MSYLFIMWFSLTQQCSISIKPSRFLPEFQDEAGVGTKVPGDKKLKISISAHVQRTPDIPNFGRWWFHSLRFFFSTQKNPFWWRWTHFGLYFFQMGWNIETTTSNMDLTVRSILKAFLFLKHHVRCKTSTRVGSTTLGDIRWKVISL